MPSWLLTGCASGFGLDDFAKTETDMVIEQNRAAVFASLRLLAEKLYKRNPAEWRKNPNIKNIGDAMERLFDPRLTWKFPELGETRSVQAILLGLSDRYEKDRVQAFIAGLASMLDDAFENKERFFITDQINPQKLYNAARNVEVAAWKLRQAKDANDRPLLLSNEIGPEYNLSFEREFGKMIANLDALAEFSARRLRRGIVKAVQTVGAFVFLPIVGL